MVVVIWKWKKKVVLFIHISKTIFLETDDFNKQQVEQLYKDLEGPKHAAALMVSSSELGVSLELFYFTFLFLLFLYKLREEREKKNKKNWHQKHIKAPMKIPLVLLKRF